MASSEVNQAFLRSSTSGSNTAQEQKIVEDDARSRKLPLMYRWKSSWQAPATMVGLLLLGCGTALGHHAFYSSLNGTRAPENLPQQRNITYGTAFAFVAKACLIAAVGTAYAQHMWSDLRTKFLEISTIDSTFTATSSIFSILDLQFLWKCKVGAIIAALAWLLPISAVITPGTLSVRPFMNATIHQLPVPTLNFSNFESFRAGDSVKASLSRLTSFVMTGVRVPPVEAFIVNSTYTLEFLGPSLKCDTPSQDVLQNIDAVFAATAGNTTGRDSVPLYNTVYVAFTPFTPVTYSGRPWPLDDVGQVASRSSDWTDFVDLCIKDSTSACSLIAPTRRGIPDDSTMGYGKTIDTSNALWLRLDEERLFCSVQRTRFLIEFDARHPVTALKSYTSTNEGVFESDSLEHAGFITAMQPLLDVLRGAAYFNARWCAKAMMQMTKCTSDLSYEISQTAAHDTALAALLYEKAANRYNKILDVALSDGQYMPPGGVGPSADPLDIVYARNLTLGTIIEEMSRNLTLSLFSDPRYVSFNSTTTTTVTTIEQVNVYNYNMRNLILAYAVAVAASTLAVVIGLYVFIVNGYTNGTGTFSSILRSTIQNRHLASEVGRTAIPSGSSRFARLSITASPEMLRLRLKHGSLLDDRGMEVGQNEEVEESMRGEIEAFGLVGQVR